MAYLTGTAPDLGDLISQLDTFLVANGWNQDAFDDGASVAAEGFAIWTKNTMNIGFKWVANAPNNMSIHQATAYSGSGFPGAQTNDSGNGFNASFGTDAQLDDERCVNDMGDDVFPSFSFFENDTSPAYVHIAVEVSTGVFRHFGFGEMNKLNTWTGGEYCFGHFADELTGSSAIDLAAYVLLDGIQTGPSSTVRRAATIRAEGLPNQGGSEKWLIHLGGASTLDSTNRTDTAGETKRVSFGGFRGGPTAYNLASFRSDVATGHIPMYPLAIFLRDFTNDFAYFLGDIPDIRGFDMFNFTPGQEITIGSDTWVLFPQVTKTEANVVGRTYYSGIAYKKVTA